MVEPAAIAEFGVFVSALRLPRIPENWWELLASWKNDGRVWIQIVDAAAVAGMRHVLFLVFNAVSAFRYGYNKLDRLEAELLLVLSGTDRFQRAIEMAGAKVGHPGVAIIIGSERSTCVHSMERIAASIVGSDTLTGPTREEGMKVAMAMGLSAPELSALRSLGDDIQAILYTLVERGSLIYC